MNSDLSLLEISGEDDSLLQQIIPNVDVSSLHNNNSNTYFECSPLQFPRFKPPITRSRLAKSPIVGRTGDESAGKPSPSTHTDSTNKENASGYKQEESKLNLEPQIMKKKKKGGGFNLRKSLAWNKAFFTEEGILDSSELSTITGNFGNSSGEMLSVIHEEERESLSDIGGSYLKENLFNKSPARNIKGEKINGTSTPTHCSPSRNNVASSSAAKRKVVSPHELNKSGSKRSGCPRPVASSTVRRSLTVNGTNASVKESKVSKIPVRKPQPGVHSTTAEGSIQSKKTHTSLTLNTTNTPVKKSKIPKIPVRKPQPGVLSTSAEGASQSKNNNTALPVNVPKRVALKGSSNNIRDTRNCASGKSLTAKFSVQARRNVVPSALENPISSGSRNLLVKKTNNSLNLKASPDPTLSASGHTLKEQESGLRKLADAPSQTANCIPAITQTAPLQIAKPSGLRMPSPSSRFFGQSKPPPAPSLLPRSMQTCNLPKNSIVNDFGQQSLEHTIPCKNEQISPVVKVLQSDEKRSLIQVRSFEHLENNVNKSSTDICLKGTDGKSASGPATVEGFPHDKDTEQAKENATGIVDLSWKSQGEMHLHNLGGNLSTESEKSSFNSLGLDNPIPTDFSTLPVADHVFQENSNSQSANGLLYEKQFSTLEPRQENFLQCIESAGLDRNDTRKSDFEISSALCLIPPAITYCCSDVAEMEECLHAKDGSLDCRTIANQCVNTEPHVQASVWEQEREKDQPSSAVTQCSTEMVNNCQSSGKIMAESDLETPNCIIQLMVPIQIEEGLRVDGMIHREEDSVIKCSIDVTNNHQSIGDLTERELENSNCMSLHEASKQVEGDTQSEDKIELRDAEDEHKGAVLRASILIEEDLTVDDMIHYKDSVTECSIEVINNYQSSGDLTDGELGNSNCTSQREACMQVEEDMKSKDVIEHGVAKDEHENAVSRNFVQIEMDLKADDDMIHYEDAVTQCSIEAMNNYESSGGDLTETELENPNCTPQYEASMQVEGDMKTDIMNEHEDAEVEHMDVVLGTSVKIEEDLKADDMIPHEDAVIEFSIEVINNYQSSGDLTEIELENSNCTSQLEACMQVQGDMKSEDLIELEDAEDEHGDAVTQCSNEVIDNRQSTGDLTKSELENSNCIPQHEARIQVEENMKTEDFIELEDAVTQCSDEVIDDRQISGSFRERELESSNCTSQLGVSMQAEEGDLKTDDMVEHEDATLREAPSFYQLGTSELASGRLSETHKIISTESMNYMNYTTSCLIEADNAPRDENSSQKGLSDLQIKSIEDSTSFASDVRLEVIIDSCTVGLHPQHTSKQDLREETNEDVQIDDIPKTSFVENPGMESSYGSLLVNTVNLTAVANDKALMIEKNGIEMLDNGDDVSENYLQVEDPRLTSIETEPSLENFKRDTDLRHDAELNVQPTSPMSINQDSEALSISILNGVGCLNKESRVIASQTPLSGDISDSDSSAFESHVFIEEAQTNVSQNNGSPDCEMLSKPATQQFDATEPHEKTDNKKQKPREIKIPVNAAPFSDEWLAAIETAGEEILTMKSGTVKHSPPEKPVPEPNPWSPVRRKNNLGIGPFDCTKFSNPNVQPSDSNYGE